MVTRGLTGGSSITANTICNNMSTGLFIQKGTDNLDVNGNTFYRNYLKQRLVARLPFTLTGWASKVKKDLLLGDGTTNIRIGANYYK